MSMKPKPDSLDGQPASNVISENLRPAEAARFTGLSESTLAKLRMRENRLAGPVFCHVGGCIVYRRSDLDDWLEANRVDHKD